MNRETIIQIAMGCNSMMVLEMREMDAKDEFLLEFAAAIRAATKEEDAGICDEKHDYWRWDDEPDSASGPRECAATIRASK